MIKVISYRRLGITHQPLIHFFIRLINIQGGVRNIIGALVNQDYAKREGEKTIKQIICLDIWTIYGLMNQYAV
jgi:hypothetical protein